MKRNGSSETWLSHLSLKCLTFIKGVDNDAKADIALQFIIISSKPINEEDDD